MHKLLNPNQKMLKMHYSSKLILIVYINLLGFIFGCSNNTGLENEISKIAKSYDFNGSILLSIGDSLQVSYSNGFSNREDGLINNSETIFYIGSTSKQFTAYAIAQLEIEGKINFQDSIQKFFSGIPEDKKEITIHQLLTHTSGLDMYHESDKGPYEEISQEEALNRIFKQKLRCMPGSEFHYSNSGFVLLALIVEKVTGNSFKEYIRKEFLEPNKITHVGFDGEQLWTRDIVATGYGFDGITHPYDRIELSWTTLGAGGMLSSVNDYANWINFILKSDLKDQLFKGHVPYPLTKKKANYGYAWVIEDNPEVEQIIYHNGGSTSTGGIATIRIYPKYNSFLIMLANDFNYEPHILFKVRKEIEDKLFVNL